MTDIYSYWEGGRPHWYYDLCWQTIRKWNPGARLLGRTDVEQVLGPIPPELDRVYVTHRVDWIRKAFIHAVGGLWLDMDFVCWCDLSPLAEASRAFDFIGWKEWQGTGWMDNFFAARVGSPILRDAADYALAQVRAFGNDMLWLAASADAVNSAMQTHQWAPWLQIPTHLIGPVCVMDREWFFGDRGKDNIHEFRSFGFMTSMHSMSGWLDNLASPEALLESPSRLAAIVRRGLGQ